MQNIVSYFFIPFIAHPLLIGTTAIILGIISHSIWILNPALFLFFACALLVVALVHTSVIKNKYFNIVLFFIICFCTGGFRLYQQKINHAHVAKELYKSKTILGCITAIDYLPHARMPYRTTLQTNTTFVQIYCIRKPMFHVGDTVHFNNITFKPSKNDSFNEFLMKEAIAASTFCTHLNYKIVKRPAWSLRRFIFNQRAHLNQKLKNKLSKKTYTLFVSLFLGNRSACKKESDNTAQQCKQWGMSHYLARSGLHLIIFILIWQLIMRLIPLSFFTKQLIILLLGIVYLSLSWTSISFIRAFMTFMLYKACVFLHVSSHFLYLLTLVCFLILIYNPIQLFFLDFQLSFALTFALAWFSHIFSKKPQ